MSSTGGARKQRDAKKKSDSWKDLYRRKDNEETEVELGKNSLTALSFL